jgi:hypothetical protein
MLKRALLTVGVVIVTGVTSGRALQAAGEHYLVAPTPVADTSPVARAAGLVTLQIIYREGDGSEFVFNCLTMRDLVDTDTLFTEDLAQFERSKTADCVATTPAH